jgi:Rieske Fe-S protein
MHAEQAMRPGDLEPKTNPGVESEATGVSRRAIMRGAAAAGVVGVAGTALASCGGDDDGGGGSGEGGGEGSVRAADIPVGGGKVVNGPDTKVVITQPAMGEFKAFSAICTHQGCTVNDISNNVISCPCHGSKYSAQDGSVQGGPAPSPLAGVSINVAGDKITFA